MFPAASEYSRILKSVEVATNARKIMNLERAIAQIKDILAQGTEDANQRIIADLTRKSNLGNPLARKRLEKLIHSVLLQNNIHVKGFSTDELAKKVYAEAYGLSLIQDIYDDPEVEEVYWNNKNRVFKVINNEDIPCSAQFNSEDHALKILQRITRGASSGEANESNPVNRTTIEDGTRISWRIPPRSKYVSANLRKHANNCYINENDFIKREIVSNDVLQLIKALAISNAAVGLIGSGGTGKTTFLKLIIRILHENTKTRMFVIERVRELGVAKFLAECGYSDENIVEVEEGPGTDLYALFQNAMQAAARMLIQGEILGPEEVANMLNVYRRGHSAGFFTAHAFPWNLPDTLATLYCESQGQDQTAVTKSLYSILDGCIYLAKTPYHSRKVVSIYEYYLGSSGESLAKPIYEYDVEKRADVFTTIQSEDLRIKLEGLKYNHQGLYKDIIRLGLLKKEGS